VGMKTRADYDRALSIMHEALQWDPYSLIEGGAPCDEFDSEAAQLVSRIPQIHSPTDASVALSQVFFSGAHARGFLTSGLCFRWRKVICSALRRRAGMRIPNKAPAPNRRRRFPLGVAARSSIISALHLPPRRR